MTPKKSGGEKIDYKITRAEAAEKFNRFLDSATTVEEIIGKWAQLIYAAKWADDRVAPRSTRSGKQMGLHNVHGAAYGSAEDYVGPAEKSVKALEKNATTFNNKLTPALRKKVEENLDSRPAF